MAALDVNEVDLNARWAGVEAAVDAMSCADLLDTARVFYGLPPKAPDFLDRLRQHFKKADDKFRMLDNTAEMQVLAGTSLVGLLESSEEWANSAALALVCPSFRGARPSAVGDIERLGREALALRAASLRQRPRAGVSVVPSETETHINNLLVAVNANTSLNAAQEQITVVLQDIVSGFKAIEQWTEDEKRQRALRTEESNALWWLVGVRRDLNIAFDQVQPPALVLIAGKELADLTSILPGPYSARAFLDKVTRETIGHTVVTLSDAVAACCLNGEGTSRLAGTCNRSRISATLFAIRKAHEADGKDAWKTVFETATGIQPARELSGVDLAEQAYREWLFARAIVALGEEDV